MVLHVTCFALIHIHVHVCIVEDMSLVLFFFTFPSLKPKFSRQAVLA